MMEVTLTVEVTVSCGGGGGTAVLGGRGDEPVKIEVSVFVMVLGYASVDAIVSSGWVSVVSCAAAEVTVEMRTGLEVW